MLTSNIKFKNFKIVKKKYKRNFFKEKWFKEIKLLESLKYNYRYSYSKKNLEKYKKKTNFTLVGMGGSILGAEAIYQFLKFKIKKKFVFIDNLNPVIKKKKSINNDVNIIISKSGNTLETILNSNLLVSKKYDFNIEESILDFWAERLKGSISTAYGDQAKQVLLSDYIFQENFGLNLNLINKNKDESK